MTRTKPSATVLALIAEVKKLGFTITPTQLERWRQQAWLPRTQEWHDPGSSPTLRSEIVQRAAWLGAASRPGRSIGWLAWVFWAIDDTQDTAKRLRAALLTTLKQHFILARADEVPTGDSDEAFRAREEAVARR